MRNGWVKGRKVKYFDGCVCKWQRNQINFLTWILLHDDWDLGWQDYVLYKGRRNKWIGKCGCGVGVRSSTISVLWDGTSFRGEPKVGFGVGDKNNKKKKTRRLLISFRIYPFITILFSCEIKFSRKFWQEKWKQNHWPSPLNSVHLPLATTHLL